MLVRRRSCNHGREEYATRARMGRRRRRRLKRGRIEASMGVRKSLCSTCRAATSSACTGSSEPAWMRSYRAISGQARRWSGQANYSRLRTSTNWGQGVRERPSTTAKASEARTHRSVDGRFRKSLCAHMSDGDVFGVHQARPNRRGCVATELYRVRRDVGAGKPTIPGCERRRIGDQGCVSGRALIRRARSSDSRRGS